MRFTGCIHRLIHKSKSFTCSSHVYQSLCDVPSSLPKITSLTALTHRSLVRVNGEDSEQLLQGLVTADVATLREKGSLYSMMLNAQGRVLYDVLLYHHGDNEHLLECDSQAVTDVIKHLKRYALRAKVEISNADSKYRIWALYPGSPPVQSDGGESLFPDPRASTFGKRLIAEVSTEAAGVCSDGNVTETTLDDYRCHRLQNGIAEGVGEIPVGNCFPLEYNLDYLNGVSFNKGCYLGQELTARTHHMGVVRKRVMPVTLSERPSIDIPTGSVIMSNSGRSLGKLISHQEKVGLALLRVKESSENKLFLNNKVCGQEIGLSPHRPSWWLSEE